MLRPFVNRDLRRESLLALAPSGFHRLVYFERGDPQAPHLVLCVHGLTRNARDFDFLAEALAAHCRVVCPDLPGRGASDWLRDPSDYRFSTYLYDCAALIARLSAPQKRRALFARRAQGEPRIDWIGTSMGGLIGLLLAARPGTPIRRLVLNDVGAFIPWSALWRLKGHVGATRYASRDAAARALREACAGFGPLEERHWQHLVAHGIEPDPAGGWRMRFDPGIGRPLYGHIDPEFPLGPNSLAGVDLWGAWEAVRAPTLVLRGERSEVLSRETLARMRALSPAVEAVEFAGVGHAPALMSEEQIAAVRDFLLRP